MKKLDDEYTPPTEEVTGLKVTMRSALDEITVVAPVFDDDAQADLNNARTGIGDALERAILTAMVYIGNDEVGLEDVNFNINFVTTTTPFQPTLEDQLRLNQALVRANKLPVGQA